MTVSRRALCVAYAVIALCALVGTWGNNLAYLGLGYADANATFWKDTMANAASRSITVDIGFLTLAVFTWMVLEARRLAMRGVWLYLLFGMVVAISVTGPLFLVHREIALARREPGAPAGRLHPLDAAGLLALAIFTIAFAARTLVRH